ncbi:MAG: hypothetical protein ABJC04_07380, partial [Verrucomicrobiota bacterium]
RLGIAYPIASKIDGKGINVSRQCVLSTGSLQEIVTVYKENELLRFKVLSTPPPIKELSPYSNLHATHLNEFYKSHEGEFRLVRLSNSKTRIEGRSWYSHQIWPSSYWKLFSDHIVREIHQRVLKHIKLLAEKDFSESLASPRAQVVQ